LAGLIVVTTILSHTWLFKSSFYSITW